MSGVLSRMPSNFKYLCHLITQIHSSCWDNSWLSWIPSCFFSDIDLLYPCVIGTAIVGLSETVSSMQKYAKQLYKHDREMAHTRIKYQYAFVMVGVVISFFTGGFVYQYYYIKGVALFE